MPADFAKLLYPFSTWVMQNALWRVVMANCPDPIQQDIDLTPEDAKKFLEVLAMFEKHAGRCFPGERMMTPEETSEAMRVLGLVVKGLKEAPHAEKPKRKSKGRKLSQGT
jgi:hypothetical protein